MAQQGSSSDSDGPPAGTGAEVDGDWNACQASLDAHLSPFQSWSARTAKRAIGLAVVLHAALRAALMGQQVGMDEAAWLRWLRLVDEHPLRCALATALGLWAAATGWRCWRPTPLSAAPPGEPSSAGEPPDPGARSC